MPSLRNFVPFSIFSLLHLQLTAAAVLSTRSVAGAASPFAVTTPFISSTLPLIAGASSLPPPPANLTLKHITIGHGIQNYTCASSNSTPVAIGAIATLYDITALALLSPDTASSIANTTAYLSLSSSLISSTPLAIPSLGSFPILGAHYFLADGTPTFDLLAVREILFSKKVADIKAPADAPKGIDGTGAVDWLSLTSINGSVGLKEVYRVSTAGGNPPATCDGYGSLVSVPYAAAYHFYG